MKGYLAIKNTGVFSGAFFGWDGSCSGETAHFRSRDFYPDILTDPAYHKKIVITDRVTVENNIPLPERNQSFMPHLAAIVFLGDIVTRSGNRGLEAYFRENRITGFVPDRKELLYDVLRLSPHSTAGLSNRLDEALSGSIELTAYRTDDLRWVATPQEYFWDLAAGEMPEEKHNVAVWDFGTSYSLMRIFRKNNCRIRVVPPDTDPEDIVALHPDGIIISGNPLSPSSAKRIIPRIERVIGIRPVLGVGGGAVTLAQTLGIEIAELTNPHHGSAVPVEEIGSGKVSATYQAHDLSIDSQSAERSGCRITHVNVCDDSAEGFVNDDYRAIGSMYTDIFQESPHYIVYFGRLIEEMSRSSLKPVRNNKAR